jgi:hypothetical protein
MKASAGQERSARGRVPVVPVILHQDTVDGEEIAQDADAALRCRTVLCNGGHISGPFPHRPEHIEINCRFESRSALMRLQHVEHQTWSQWTFSVNTLVHEQPPVL